MFPTGSIAHNLATNRLHNMYKNIVIFCRSLSIYSKQWKTSVITTTGKCVFTLQSTAWSLSTGQESQVGWFHIS